MNTDRFVIDVLTGAIVGTVAASVAGIAMHAMVPTAMSTLGTVIAGVGTLHAPMAAGGIAATLQFCSAYLLTVSGVGSFAVLGAVIWSLFQR